MQILDTTQIHKTVFHVFEEISPETKEKVQRTVSKY